MTEIKVFLEGDIIPAGLNVANRKGYYFCYQRDQRANVPLVVGLERYEDRWEQVVAAEREKRAIEERGPDGLPTAAASKAIGELFDRDFPHGTLCDCQECLKREVARLREAFEEQGRQARRDRAHAVRANAGREAARAELREAIDELADRQKFLQQVIVERDLLHIKVKERNKIARKLADAYDDMAALKAELSTAKETILDLESEVLELQTRVETP